MNGYTIQKLPNVQAFIVVVEKDGSIDVRCQA